jgi:hypothetical protein
MDGGVVVERDQIVAEIGDIMEDKFYADTLGNLDDLISKLKDAIILIESVQEDIKEYREKSHGNGRTVVNHRRSSGDFKHIY